MQDVINKLAIAVKGVSICVRRPGMGESVVVCLDSASLKTCKGPDASLQLADVEGVRIDAKVVDGSVLPVLHPLDTKNIRISRVSGKRFVDFGGLNLTASLGSVRVNLTRAVKKVLQRLGGESVADSETDAGAEEERNRLSLLLASAGANSEDRETETESDEGVVIPEEIDAAQGSGPVQLPWSASLSLESLEVAVGGDAAPAVMRVVGPSMVIDGGERLSVTVATEGVRVGDAVQFVGGLEAKIFPHEEEMTVSAEKTEVYLKRESLVELLSVIRQEATTLVQVEESDRISVAEPNKEYEKGDGLLWKLRANLGPMRLRLAEGRSDAAAGFHWADVQVEGLEYVWSGGDSVGCVRLSEGKVFGCCVPVNAAAAVGERQTETVTAGVNVGVKAVSFSDAKGLEVGEVFAFREGASGQNGGGGVSLTVMAGLQGLLSRVGSSLTSAVLPPAPTTVTPLASAPCPISAGTATPSPTDASSNTPIDVKAVRMEVDDVGRFECSGVSGYVASSGFLQVKLHEVVCLRGGSGGRAVVRDLLVERVRQGFALSISVLSVYMPGGESEGALVGGEEGRDGYRLGDFSRRVASGVRQTAESGAEERKRRADGGDGYHFGDFSRGLLGRVRGAGNPENAPTELEVVNTPESSISSVLEGLKNLPGIVEVSIKHFQVLRGRLLVTSSEVLVRADPPPSVTVPPNAASAPSQSDVLSLSESLHLPSNHPGGHWGRTGGGSISLLEMTEEAVHPRTASANPNEAVLTSSPDVKFRIHCNAVLGSLLSKEDALNLEEAPGALAGASFASAAAFFSIDSPCVTGWLKVDGGSSSVCIRSLGVFAKGGFLDLKGEHSDYFAQEAEKEKQKREQGEGGVAEPGIDAQLPNANIVQLQMRVSVKGVTTKVKGVPIGVTIKPRRMTLPAFQGNPNTTPSSILSYYTQWFTAHVPDLLLALSIGGTSVRDKCVEGLGYAAAGIAGRSVVGGTVSGTAALCLVDGVFACVDAGKKARGEGSDASYQFGDFTEGLVTFVCNGETMAKDVANYAKEKRVVSSTAGACLGASLGAVGGPAGVAVGAWAGSTVASATSRLVGSVLQEGGEARRRSSVTTASSTTAEWPEALQDLLLPLNDGPVDGRGPCRGPSTTRSSIPDQTAAPQEVIEERTVTVREGESDETEGDGYQFGDFCRGVTARVQRTSEMGAEARRGEEARGRGYKFGDYSAGLLKRMIKRG
uniref:Uncharacterized protein n=1 Tax=Chromera velia CCMP2878 TaxID=1169474 RepID=A0A0G4I5D4_9ALVE|eukprot:Cvel_11144.t1-p1 / transcript=Cvel_11144.t1 / gene=Cvel_11144 / organism=Chromera_velia_CCMP2878 / gene_product=hypothetical protein / transcript_product=hypothetical protein / location=Cvel_scaffold691:14672-18599(-) / protein_length=1216 / sequence_SO=supercontig / SO=protein_coding / is_pseudo=false